MSDSASGSSHTTLQPFSNSRLPQPPSFRVRQNKVEEYSDLNEEDKKSIVFHAAAYLQDQERSISDDSSSSSRLRPPNITTYIGALTNDLIYKCNKNALVSSSGIHRSDEEEAFLSTSVAEVQAQMKKNKEAEEEELKLSQSLEPQLKAIPPKRISPFGKLIYCGCIALSIAYALLFWPDLNSYLQSPEVLNCAAGTIGQIAFGFCLLAGVLLAIAVLAKPKPLNRYKMVKGEFEPITETLLLARQNQPSKGMRILAGILFSACAAALVLFTGGIDGSKMPAVSEAIRGISSLSALICSCFFVAALILPRVVRFLRATFCPTCCNNDATNRVLDADEVAHRDAVLAQYTHGEEGSAIPSVLRNLNDNESEESFQSRLGF